ncbi:O-antigen ligase [Mesorhizobium sp. BAC0120]|uniref:O-antigen ligase family protein n=1 Tax=Mesorhizobium sp. BAC0120 TaxID=3090670 RepID=UPI00298C5CCB|nr:O-antigen ligase [Mesorhizobium sp. BAC0120]MDW6025786.1 O-antigen ligase [Mesorhizobium sp. BAC0120]
MSSTESLRRTERGAVGAGFSERRIATIIASLLFTVMLVSFRPFQPTGALESQDADPAAGGDIVNQVGFLSLGLLAIFSLLCYVDRRKLAALLSPWWLLLLGFFFLSVVNATDPAAGTRAAIFTLMGIISMAAVISLPRDAESFSYVIAIGGFTVVGLSYFGLVALPNQAMHTAFEVESEHAGLWRGIFSHKNVAGPVMACLSFGGLYLWRRGWTRAGGLLFVAAMVFVFNTGSKTTAGLVPLAILFVMMPSLIGMRLLTPILVAATLIVTALATLGIVFIEPLKELANELAPGLDYTGRTTLWAFAGEMIAQRPWLGYGFQSIWGTPLVQDRPLWFDDAWDIRGIVHGHDSYLDIALSMGLPATVVAAITFMLVPIRDYMRVPLYRENVYLGDLFMMVTLFISLNGFLETFFLRRADPVWLFLVFGALGLRMTARFPMPGQ